MRCLLAAFLFYDLGCPGWAIIFVLLAFAGS